MGQQTSRPKRKRREREREKGREGEVEERERESESESEEDEAVEEDGGEEAEKRRRRRHHIVREMQDTEQSYVDALTAMRVLYKVPMLQVRRTACGGSELSLWCVSVRVCSSDGCVFI